MTGGILVSFTLSMAFMAVALMKITRESHFTYEVVIFLLIVMPFFVGRNSVRLLQPRLSDVFSNDEAC